MPPIKPEVLAMPDGRIGVFLGADYKFLTPAAARQLRDKLTAALDEPRNGPPVAEPVGARAILPA